MADIKTTTPKGCRVNLNVYAKDEEGKIVVYPMHIGFFPKKVAETVMANLDARGLAFGAAIPRQIGRCKIELVDMRDNSCRDRFLEYNPGKVILAITREERYPEEIAAEEAAAA